MEQNEVNTVDPKALLGKELAEQLEAEKVSEESVRRQRESDDKAAEDARKKNKKVILKNTLGEKMDQRDYFYSTKGEDAAPLYFNDVCGQPVDREDLLTVFNKIFKPKDGILFYKASDKEVYIIIVPLKHSSIVGAEHNSIDGEFQKHAISFVSEGSVNIDSLKVKLVRVASTIKIAE